MAAFIRYLLKRNYSLNAGSLFILLLSYADFFSELTFSKYSFRKIRTDVLSKSDLVPNCSQKIPGRVAQSVTCLATDACLTADPGVASSIPARYHTFVEIDHEIIPTVILLLPLIYSRRVVVSYKRKYVHKLLVNRLLKPAQEKVWLSELTVPQ